MSQRAGLTSRLPIERSKNGGLAGVTLVRRAGGLAWLGLVAAAATMPLAAQERTPELLRRVVGEPAVLRALETVGREEERAVATLIELASIVSPSGREHRRAAAVAERMRQIGLAGVTLDSTPNVVGTIPGTSGRALIFVTMLDDLPKVVEFQRKAGRPPHRQGGRVAGPATEIQSVTAAMLIAAEALVRSGVRPRHDLVFAAVAGEETGLQGMEALYTEFRSRAVAFVDVLGDGREIHYGAGGAIAWWRVVARGPGGHTSTGGLPNVNQAIARAIDAIFSLPHPERHKDRETAINVAVIESGEVFNYKPDSGWFSLAVRSLDRAVVDQIGREVEAILRRTSAETGIGLEMQSSFYSPGGQIPGARDSLLVREAAAAARYLGYEPELSEFGCCNMRLAVERGTLAIGVHGERGGGRATASEWADIRSMMNTARHIVLLAATAGGLR